MYDELKKLRTKEEFQEFGARLESLRSDKDGPVQTEAFGALQEKYSKKYTHFLRLDEHGPGIFSGESFSDVDGLFLGDPDWHNSLLGDSEFQLTSSHDEPVLDSTEEESSHTEAGPRDEKDEHSTFRLQSNCFLL